MRKLALSLIIVLAALLSQNSHALTLNDDPFEFYRQDINSANVIDIKTLVDATNDDGLTDYLIAKHAYDDFTGIIPNRPFEDRFRRMDISVITSFKADFTSTSELEPSTLLLVGIGILGLLTYRRRRLG